MEMRIHAKRLVSSKSGSVEVGDEMNLDMDIGQAKNHVNTAYKRNHLDTTIRNIDDSLLDLENMLADQVALDILLEILDELNDLMIPYAKVMAPLLDIPPEEVD